MITPTPIIIQTPESPRCPHCRQELEGWSEPSDTSFKELVMGFLVLGFILLQLGFSVAGALEGAVEDSPNEVCGKWFQQRWNYVLPTYQVSCRAVEWLRNKEDKETE